MAAIDKYAPLVADTSYKIATATRSIGFSVNAVANSSGSGGEPESRALATHVQQFSLSAEVSLFELDLTPLGGEVVRITAMTDDGAVVTFDGEEYLPWPVEMTGLEWNGKGQLPQPKLRIGDVVGTFTGLSIEYGDFIGAKFRRKRTFGKFLDSGDDPRPEAFVMEEFVVERKAAHGPQGFEFDLSSVLDQENVKLPAVQVLKNTCPRIYRTTADGVTFANTPTNELGCPYVGIAMFDKNGDPVTQKIQDQCGKRLSDCVLRMGNSTAVQADLFGGGKLPYGGVPGVDQLRT